MKCFKGEQYLSSIKFGLFFMEFILQREKSKQLPAGAVLEDEVKFMLILKRLFEFDQKGVVQLYQYGFFSHDIFFLMFFNDIFFLEHFHRVHLLIGVTPNEQNLRVGALAYHRQRFIVLETRFVH